MSSKPISRRKNAYKKGIDADEGRRKREQGLVQIRKSKRQDSLSNRRLGGGVLLRLQPELECLPSIVKGVFCDDYEKQLEATTQLRKLLSTGDCLPIEEVISTGIVPRLVEFLDMLNLPQLQIESSWALANIASGNQDHTLILINSNAIPMFVQLLHSRFSAVREQAVWALGNIVGDSGMNRDMVLSHGALMPLLAQLESPQNFSMIRCVTWALSNMCRADPPCYFDKIKPMVPTLARLICLDDEKVLIDACSALSHITNGANEDIQAVIDAGVCSRLVELLRHPSAAVLVPALRALGNIVTGDDAQTQVVIDKHGLPYLNQILTQINDRNVKKEACWVISNITAGNNSQIQAVIDANIIPLLISLLQRAEFDVKKEAAWAISNATCGSAVQIHVLVSQGCVKPLCDLLACSDPRTVAVCLDAIESILESGESIKDARNSSSANIYLQIVYECDGIDKIEGLLSHKNNEIYEKAVKILEKYWVKEEMEEEWQNLQAGFNLRSLTIA